MRAHRSRAGERPLSIEEYERLPRDPSHRVELVRGRLARQALGGMEHGWILGKVAGCMASYLRERRLGITCIRTEFVLSTDPPTVRIPDIAFIDDFHLPPEGIPIGRAHLAPDVAVDIATPETSASDVHEKALDFLAAGTCVVWVVHPRRREATVCRGADDVTVLREGESLAGGRVMPGLRISLTKLFAR